MEIANISSPASTKKTPTLITAEPAIKPYESIFIMRPSLSEEEIATILEKVKTIIEEQGGEVVSSSNWGKKKLAYEVQKERKGIYVVLHFKGKGASIAELERFYRFSESIIKYMTINIDSDKLGKTDPIREEKTFAYRGRNAGRGF